LDELAYGKFNVEPFLYVFCVFIFGPHPNLFPGRGEKGGLGFAKSYCVVYHTKLSGEQLDE
jgi:hypothetical protein